MGSNPTSPTMENRDLNRPWSANLAYAIGLLATDGCLSKDGRHIIFRSSDHQLAEVFNYCLGSSAPIVETKPNHNTWAIKPSYRIQYSNAKLYRWLLSIGITPAKSHTIAAIDIPDIYFPDFLRGHSDGDGTVQTYLDNYNIYKGRRYTHIRVMLRFLSASKTHIAWLRARITELTGNTGAIISRQKHTGTTMWELKFSKKEALKLIAWMYYQPNLPCLKRKEVIAEKAVSASQLAVRKTYSLIEQ